MDHASLLRTFYANLAVLLSILVPLGYVVAFAVHWTRAMGIHFGPDVPVEVEERWAWARQLIGLGFALPEETLGPSPDEIPRRSRPCPRGRRLLRLGIGAWWLVGAGLSVQPAVALGDFLRASTLPVARMGPPWLHGVVYATAQVWRHNPVAMGLALVALQLTTAGLCLAGFYAGVWLSMLLSLGFWVFLEAFGGLLSGVSFLGLAPGAGAALLLASALAAAPARAWRAGPLQRTGVRAVGALWLLGAALQTWGPFWRTWTRAFVGVPAAVLHSGRATVALRWLMHLAGGAPATVNAAAVVAMAAFGAVLVRSGAVRGRAGAAVAAWLAFVWVVPEAFGGIWTGQALDAGTAVAWGLILWACSLDGEGAILPVAARLGRSSG